MKEARPQGHTLCNPTGRNYVEQVNPETESRLVDDHDGGRREWGGMVMGTGFPSGETEMFWNSIEVVVAQHHECTTCCGIIYSKMVNFM